MTPIYAVDDMVRNAVGRAAVRIWMMQAAVRMNAAQAQKPRSWIPAKQVQVKQGDGTAVLPFVIDEGVADRLRLDTERDRCGDHAGRKFTATSSWRRCLDRFPVVDRLELPAELSVPGVKRLISVTVILVPLFIVVAYYTLAERKVIGYMQIRKGPNRVGPKGCCSRLRTCSN